MSENFEARLNCESKDSVFTHLFRDPKYALELFRCLHPEAKDVTEDMIRIVSQETVMATDIYSNLGFIAGDRLVILTEAHGRWSRNILIHAFMFLMQTFSDFFNNREMDLYETTKVNIPKPEVYVIYTGKTKKVEEGYSLSLVFYDGEESDVELKVHVQRDGEKGDILHQYVMFSKVFNKQVELLGKTRGAAVETIRICKDKDFLKEYLIENEKEVIAILALLFNADTIREMEIREVRKQERKAFSLKLYNDGMPIEEISDFVEESVDQVQRWVLNPQEDEEEDEDEDDDDLF